MSHSDSKPVATWTVLVWCEAVQKKETPSKTSQQVALKRWKRRSVKSAYLGSQDFWTYWHGYSRFIHVTRKSKPHSLETGQNSGGLSENLTPLFNFYDTFDVGIEARQKFLLLFHHVLNFAFELLGRLSDPTNLLKVGSNFVQITEMSVK